MRSISLAAALACIVVVLAPGSATSAPTESRADIATLVSGPATAEDGQLLTYTVTVRNFGPDSAMDVRSSVPLLRAGPFTLKTVAASGATCAAETTTDGTTIRCSAATLASGGAATVTLTMQFYGNSEVRLGATSTSAGADPDAANNASSLLINERPRTSRAFSATLVTKTLPVGYPGEPYRYHLPITGGMSPYTSVAVPPTNAPGITVTPDGWVIGTPVSSGSYALAIRITDVFQARIGLPTTPVALTLLVQERPPLELVRGLPKITAGVRFEVALVTGGTVPYGIKASRGSVPAGWRLGVGARLSGTPDRSGPYVLHLFASDAVGREAEATLSGTVQAPAGYATRPNLIATPGSKSPAVTQRTIGTTICSSSWRPAGAGLSSVEQRAVLRRYGLPQATTGYTFSRLVPIALGGAVHNLVNIWPQLVSGAAASDRLDRQLLRQVCRKTLTLAAAQKQARDRSLGVSR